VLVRAPKVNKFSSYYDPVPYKVTDVKGSMITAARPGHVIRYRYKLQKKNRQFAKQQHRSVLVLHVGQKDTLQRMSCACRVDLAYRSTIYASARHATRSIRSV